VGFHAVVAFNFIRLWLQHLISCPDFNLSSPFYLSWNTDSGVAGLVVHTQLS
jgi:hypothetical protein